MANQAGIDIGIGGTSIKYGIVNVEGKIEWETKKPSKSQTSRQEVEKNILAEAKEA